MLKGPLRTIALLAAIAAAAVATTAGALADAAYPSKAVRVIVPFAAGGGTDLIGRTVAQKLQESLGQPFVVENIGGAGGNIGTDAVAKAAPDGYTLLLGYNSNFSISPFLYPDLPYKPLEDFEPVSLVAVATNILAVHPSVPANTLGELQALAKGGETLHYGSAGVGTLGHLTVELFKSRAGIDLVHVPYKGNSAALTDLLAGRVQVFAGSPAAVVEYVEAGRLRALGVSSPERVEGLKDVPTFQEQGFDVEAIAWFGLMAPKGTPREIVEKLNQHVVAAMQDPAVKASFAKIGYNVEASTIEAFATYMKADYDKWEEVVKTSGATAD